jgi:hypothetical protein
MKELYYNLSQEAFWCAVSDAPAYLKVSEADEWLQFYFNCDGI